MIKKKSFLIFLLCLCLALSGCGKSESESGSAAPSGGFSLGGPKPVQFAAGEIAPETTELSIVLQSGETELLAKLPQLKSADFSGSDCLDEIIAWADANPQVQVKYTVPLADGTALDPQTDTLDLSQFSGEQIRACLDNFKYLPELRRIELGVERANLAWEDIGMLQQALPDVKLKYIFNLYGLDVELENTQINLSHVPVEDGGAAVREAMAYMPNLCYLDMDSCGVSNQDMAAIRDAYPDVKVVWRIWFGEWDVYSVRTDVERILASRPTVGGEIYPGNCEALQYCTEVKYLDLGHNENMTDISFMSTMTKLEVAVLAMANWSDASPLANCKNLEYLEIQTTNCTDLSPLAELKNLKHLNVAYIPDLEDISPLYGLTQLERLWIGCMNNVPYEQVQQMQAAAPDCEINIDVYVDPTGGRWRYVDYNSELYVYIYHPRYIQLREQFDDYVDSAFSFSWNDPLFY